MSNLYRSVHIVCYIWRIVVNVIEGKIALVTGANRGIGKEIVIKFLALGAKKVYAAARNLESLKPLKNIYGDRIVPLHIDLNIPETIQAAASTADDVNIVVNNAGMLNVASSLSVNAVEALKEEMEVNVYGLIYMAQAFSPVLKTNGGGAFIQLNSVASIKNFADFSTYSASKAAAYSITQGLRTLFKEQGTQVISVLPGPIDTDMARAAGLTDLVEPAELVADSIIEALENQKFHAYPGSIATDVGKAYADFSTNIIEAA